MGSMCRFSTGKRVNPLLSFLKNSAPNTSRLVWWCLHDDDLGDSSTVYLSRLLKSANGSSWMTHRRSQSRRRCARCQLQPRACGAAGRTAPRRLSRNGRRARKASRPPLRGCRPVAATCWRMGKPRCHAHVHALHAHVSNCKHATRNTTHTCSC